MIASEVKRCVNIALGRRYVSTVPAPFVLATLSMHGASTEKNPTLFVVSLPCEKKPSFVDLRHQCASDLTELSGFWKT